MKPPTSPEQLRVLRALADRLILTIEFFQRAQDFPSGPQLRSVVENALENRDLRRLRLIDREIEMMTAGLSASQLDGLSAILLDRLGVDRSAKLDEIRRQVQSALKPGAELSERVRGRLEDYLAILEAAGDAADEMAAIRQRLAPK